MLDPLSLLIITIGSAVMGMAVLGSLLRSGIPGVRRWFCSCLLATAALLLFALRGAAPDWVSILCANALMTLALMVVLEGCRQFLGRKPQRVGEYLAWGGMLACLAFWTYVLPDINPRIVVVSALHAYLYGALAWAISCAQPFSHPRYAYRFVGITAAIGSAGQGLRALLYCFEFAHQTELMESDSLNMVFMAIGILAVPCLSIGMVLLAHDRLAYRLERLANLDELTGILGRRAFLLQAESAIRTAARTGRPLSLAILDIDHFKRINDTHGHAVGDQVLAHFTSVVTGSLRASDTFGRLGGEEFAVLCPETRLADATSLLNRLRTKVAQAGWMLKGEALDVRFSSGVDEYRPGEALVSLMARADAALYAAKAMGRDRVVGVPYEEIRPDAEPADLLLRPPAPGP